jgi:hypothetical protein
MTLWGRTLGVLSTVGAMLLWLAFAFFNPNGAADLGADTLLIVFLMVTLASTGLGASLFTRPWLLLLAAAASFIPVGLHLLLNITGVIRWIGALNLMTLSAALMLVVDQRRNRAA